MRWFSKFLVLGLALSLSTATAQNLGPPGGGTPAPCSAFGRTAGTCAQGNLPGDVTAETTPGAGNIGEVLSGSNSAQAIVSNTVTNTLTLSVTAGHWSCFGSIRSNPGGATTQSNMALEVGTNSTPTFTNLPPQGSISNIAVSTAAAIISGPWFFNFTTTTNVFVIAFDNYAVSTLTMNSSLACTRIF